MKIGVVHEQARQGLSLARALEREGLTVLWTAQDLESARLELTRGQVDALFWSVRVNGSTRLIQSLPSATRVVAVYARDQDLAAVDDAMAAGAVLAIKLGDGAESISLSARIQTLRRLSQRASMPTEVATRIVAIGASTGGPQALASLCAALPAGFGSALVIVQHIEAAFMPELEATLAARSRLRVCFAGDGTSPEPGTIHVASEAARHLVLDEKQRFRYVAAPENVLHRPSIDVLFESLARNTRTRGTAILLTGMGRDGARGLGALRRAGWRTIAQDERTSVVYGMPRAAVEEGAASEVLALDDIAPALVRGP